MLMRFPRTLGSGGIQMGMDRAMMLIPMMTATWLKILPMHSQKIQMRVWIPMATGSGTMRIVMMIMTG